MYPNEACIQAMLDRITYKPGWKLEIVHDPLRRPRKQWESIPIRCMFPVKDVDTGCDIILCFMGSIYPESTEEHSDKYLLHAIESLIRNAEDHEFKEWFKVDGFCLYDPHPGIPGENRQTYDVQGFHL